MKKTMTILAIAGFILALAPAAQAAIIPPIGYDGPYRLLLISSTARTAQATDIATYNGYVTADAAARISPPAYLVGATWTAVASINDRAGGAGNIDARDNTGTNPNDETGIPIYTSNGLRIADDNAELWGGTLQNFIYNFDGTSTTPPGNPNQIWSGTNSDGTASTTGSGSMGYPIGTVIRAGLPANLTGWVGGTARDVTDVRGIYAMSSVIPEPATMSLLAIGGIALIRRKRRA